MATTPTIHIISFDVPYPANYGGVIDVYHRLRWLKKKGVKVILHCFLYARPKAKELDALCEQVFYYQRDTSIRAAFSRLPYAVQGRINKDLLHNLLQDDYPIVFDGLVSCGLMSAPELQNRRLYYRESNIEHHYYLGLAKASRSVLKSIYYHIEARRLERFEAILHHATALLTVSRDDTAYFRQHYPNIPVHYIPSFHPNDEMRSTVALNRETPFVLYHGNLSLSENENAVLYLIEKVFPQVQGKCIIAGMNPTQRIRKATDSQANITLIANPRDEQMAQLVAEAQVHILVTFQGTGLKLKLLNSLFQGKHIIANHTMLAGNDLAPLCHIADTPDEQINACNLLLQQPFDTAEQTQRADLLLSTYGNETNINRFLQVVCP